jgi:exo-beta-1,3-glucanase (GH17 family)
MLAAIAPYIKGIRIFGMNDGLENIPRIANTEFGLEVIAGIWLDQNSPANEQGFTNLAAAVNSGYVKVATLGNEVLLFGYINPTNAADNEAKLIAYIQRFKLAIAGKVPVTTVDVYDELLAHPAVMSVCDQLFVNVYPLNCDGTFAIDTVTGGIDDLATEIRLYLIPEGYDPPALGFIVAPPAELAANAVVIVSIRRDPGGSVQIVTLKP